MTNLLGAAEIRAIASDLNIRPTKQWGQNFVIDGNTVRRIVREAHLQPSDVVIEVGPGLGSLTLGLLPEVAGVIAVEIDQRLADRLPVTIAQHAPADVDKLTVICADAMSLTATSLSQSPTALVANLPYNVAVPVILHLLTELPSLRTILVMVQAEVADRLAAQPGSKTYGVPSVKARWFGSVEKAGSIGRQVFWPAPRVDSGLVRIDCHPQPDADRSAVFAVVDAAFGQRRKTLRAALSGLAGSAAAAETALTLAGIDPSLRGEQCDLETFIRITRALEL